MLLWQDDPFDPPRYSIFGRELYPGGEMLCFSCDRCHSFRRAPEVYHGDGFSLSWDPDMNRMKIMCQMCNHFWYEPEIPELFRERT